MSGDKFGNFDWIVNFDQLRPYVTKCEESEGSGATVTEILTPRKALVIGCGTSTVSERLLDAGFDVVVSMDNDAGCIEHMKLKTFADNNNGKLVWCVADIITGEGFDATPHLNEPQQYDVILDKGTLDAILVEGVVYEALVNVYNLLKVGGKYLVCSLSPPGLLMPLLCAPVLKFEVTCFESCNYGGEKPYSKDDITTGLSTSSDTWMPALHDSMRGTIITCIKTEHNSDFQIAKTVPSLVRITGVIAQLSQWEDEVMNKYFQEENSLVTDKLKSSLYAHFYTDNKSTTSVDATDGTQKQLYPEGTLPIRSAYLAMFGGDDNELGYSFDLFVGDFASYRAEKLEEQQNQQQHQQQQSSVDIFVESSIDSMRIHHDEALDFIASMQ